MTLISDSYTLYHNLESEYIIGLPTEETNYFQTKHVILDTMLMLLLKCHETMKIILVVKLETILNVQFICTVKIKPAEIC